MQKLATTVTLVVEGPGTPEEILAAVHESLESWGRARTPFAYVDNDAKRPIFLLEFDPVADGQENL